MKTLTSFLGIKVKEKKQDKSKLVTESNAEGRNSNNPLAAASTTSPNSMAGVDENNTRFLAIFSDMLQNPTQLGSTLEIITRLLPDNVQVKELLAFIPTIHSAPREIEDYLRTQLNDIFKDIILPRITSTQWQEIIPQLNGAPRDEAAIRDRIVTIILDSLPTWLNQPLLPLEIVHKEGTWQVNRCFTQQDSGSTVNFPTQSGQLIEARVLFENEQFRLQLSGVNPEEHLTGVTLQTPLLTTPYPIEMIENGQEEKPSRIGQKFILRPRKGGAQFAVAARVTAIEPVTGKTTIVKLHIQNPASDYLTWLPGHIAILQRGRESYGQAIYQFPDRPEFNPLAPLSPAVATTIPAAQQITERLELSVILKPFHIKAAVIRKLLQPPTDSYVMAAIIAGLQSQTLTAPALVNAINLTSLAQRESLADRIYTIIRACL